MRRKDAGHSSLYLMMFLPLLLGAGALAFDLSRLNASNEQLQTALDEIALSAAHLLPDADLTRIRAEELLAGFPKDEAHVIVDKLGASVLIEVSVRRTEYLLSTLLEAFNLQSSLPLQRLSTEAQLLPIDAAVILSDGLEQRPWSSNLTQSPWPTSYGLGEASSALEGCIKISHGRYSNSSIAQYWNTSEGRRWLTQSCFNPVFSRIKLTAMNVVERLLSLGNNRTAVIFTPANNGQGEIVRSIHERRTQEGNISYGGFGGESSAASWEPYQDLEHELGDEACILFSDAKTAYRGEYDISRFQKGEVNGDRCSEPVSLLSCNTPFRVGELGRLNTKCLSRSSVAQAIYWRSARRPYSQMTAIPDFYRAIELALSEMVSGGSVDELREEGRRRGQLAGRPLRVVIVLTSFLPELVADSPMWEMLRRASASLIIGYMERRSFPSEAIDPFLQPGRVGAWKDYLSSFEGDERLASALLYAGSPQEFSEQISERLVSLFRRSVLKK
jgi:hypothetical protein